MQAYRLEMGTKLPIGVKKNLYDFWKNTLTEHLNLELKNEELLVNLASIEYFSTLDIKKLKVPVITPEFKDYKDGKLKMISFFLLSKNYLKLHDLWVIFILCPRGLHTTLYRSMLLFTTHLFQCG